MRPCHKRPCELVISKVKTQDHVWLHSAGNAGYCLKQEACRKHLSSLSLDQSQSHSRSSEALRNAVRTKLITLHSTRMESRGMIFKVICSSSAQWLVKVVRKRTSHFLNIKAIGSSPLWIRNSMITNETRVRGFESFCFCSSFSTCNPKTRFCLSLLLTFENFWSVR